MVLTDNDWLQKQIRCYRHTRVIVAIFLSWSSWRYLVLYSQLALQILIPFHQFYYLGIKSSLVEYSELYTILITNDVYAFSYQY